MHPLKLPSASFEVFFISCVTESYPKRTNAYLDKLSLMIEQGQFYNERMKAHQGHQLQPIDSKKLLPLKPDHYKNLYSQKVVAGNGPGRFLYDEILSEAKQTGCCYCTYEEPTEIDHLLPYSRYAQFAICPLNLVPVCHRCNRHKLDFWPSDLKDNFIHPYYEDYSQKQWLVAAVSINKQQPIISYSIDFTEFENAVIPERIQSQFFRLHLFERYSVQASRELAARQSSTFKTLIQHGGRRAFQKWLTDEYQDQFQVNKNSWKTAVYKAILQSNSYLDFITTKLS